MKATAISILLLLVLPLASALEFTFNSPESAALNATFSVSISASSSDSHDVKIFVLDKSTARIISEVYSDGWKNPYYYLKSAFPGKSNFDVRITSSSSNAEICARMRKSGASAYSEKCNTIAVGSSDSSADTNEVQESSDEEEVEENKTLLKKAPSPDFVPANIVKEDSSPIAVADNEKIVLNSVEKSSFVTKEEKMRLYAVYAFTFLAMVIVVFIIMRKL